MFTLDIETIPWFRNEKHKNQVIHSRLNKRLTNPELKAANYQKILDDAALSPLTGALVVFEWRAEIVVVGFGYKDVTEIIITSNRITKLTESSRIHVMQNEQELLDKTWDMIAGYLKHGEVMITWNGKEFDIPFLFQRSLIHNIEPPDEIAYDDLIHKYRNEPHCDLRTLLPKGSMDVWMATLGIDDKVMEGSDISKMWTKNPMKVIEKCIKDLERNTLLWERLSKWIAVRLPYPKSNKEKVLTEMNL